MCCLFLTLLTKLLVIMFGDPEILPFTLSLNFAVSSSDKIHYEQSIPKLFQIDNNSYIYLDSSLKFQDLPGSTESIPLLYSSPITIRYLY